jgi:hypothetical protein
MADLNHQLKRLIESASRANPNVDHTMPLGFETRVLAKWREVRITASFAPIYRQAMILSIGLACIAVIFSYQDWRALRDLNDWQNIGLRVANAEIERRLP